MGTTKEDQINDAVFVIAESTGIPELDQEIVFPKVYEKAGGEKRAPICQACLLDLMELAEKFEKPIDRPLTLQQWWDPQGRHRAKDIKCILCIRKRDHKRLQQAGFERILSHFDSSPREVLSLLFTKTLQSFQQLEQGRKAFMDKKEEFYQELSQNLNEFRADVKAVKARLEEVVTDPTRGTVTLVMRMNSVEHGLVQLEGKRSKNLAEVLEQAARNRARIENHRLDIEKAGSIFERRLKSLETRFGKLQKEVKKGQNSKAKIGRK